jgi:hypothetical protein
MQSNECSRMHAVEEILLQSRHSFGTEAKAKRRWTSDVDCIQSEAPPKLPFIQDKKPTQEEKEQAQERERQRACSYAVIQSEAKPRRGGSSGAECIQSEPAPKPPFSHEKKPTQSQEEKERAEQSNRHKQMNNEYSRIH